MLPSVSEEVIARQSPEAQQIIRGLLAHIASLTERLGQVQAALEQLRQRPGANPQNSSVPPSSVHPHARPTPKKPRGKRKPGAQNGHPRHSRVLIPTERCDQVLPLRPFACRRCGRPLGGHDPDPLRHQV